MFEDWIQNLYGPEQVHLQHHLERFIYYPLLAAFLVALVLFLFWYRRFRSEFMSDPKSRRSMIARVEDLEPWEEQREQKQRAYRVQHELWDFVSGRHKRRPPPPSAE